MPLCMLEGERVVLYLLMLTVCGGVHRRLKHRYEMRFQMPQRKNGIQSICAQQLRTKEVDSFKATRVFNLLLSIPERCIKNVEKFPVDVV
jgi:hypothetical protein